MSNKSYNKRDHTICKNYKREVNLQTKTIKSKKTYSRKQKYKNDEF